MRCLASSSQSRENSALRDKEVENSVHLECVSTATPDVALESGDHLLLCFLTPSLRLAPPQHAADSFRFRGLRLGNMLIYKLATVLLVLSLTAAARPHSPGVRVLAVAKEYALQHGIRPERVLIVAFGRTLSDDNSSTDLNLLVCSDCPEGGAKTDNLQVYVDSFILNALVAPHRRGKQQNSTRRTFCDIH